MSVKRKTVQQSNKKKPIKNPLYCHLRSFVFAFIYKNISVTNEIGNYKLQ